MPLPDATTTQSDADGQERSAIRGVPVGNVRLTHWAPPSVVETIWPVPEWFDPTSPDKAAKHADVVGHDKSPTPLTPRPVGNGTADHLPPPFVVYSPSPPLTAEHLVVVGHEMPSGPPVCTAGSV